MERRLKLKSMKRVASHKLKEAPSSSSSSSETDKPNVFRNRKLSFTNGCAKPPVSDTVAFTNGSKNAINCCYLRAPGKSVNVFDETIRENETLQVKTLGENENCNIKQLSETDNSKANIVDGDTIGEKENIIDGGLLSSNYGGGGINDLDTQFNNAVNDSLDIVKHIVDAGAHVSTSKRTSISVVAKDYEQKYYGNLKHKYVHDNGGKEYRDYDSDTGCDSDRSDLLDGDGVSMHLVNYNKNNSNIFLNGNSHERNVGNVQGCPSNEYNSVISSTNNTSTIIINSTEPETGNTKSFLKKSKSLTIHSNNLKQLNIVNKNKQIASSFSNLKITEIDTAEMHNSSIECEGKTNIADGLVVEVSQCIENSLSSLHLGRIDENGTNTVRETSSEIPHFACTDNDNFSKWSSYSQQIPYAPVNPSHKIRHSKSDVHISSVPISREVSPSDETKTVNSSEKSPSRAFAIRRTKSRHEGQLFGFKIDGFSVRKLGQRKRLSNASRTEIPDMKFKDDFDASGSDSCVGSDASEVDGAKMSSRGRRINRSATINVHSSYADMTSSRDSTFQVLTNTTNCPENDDESRSNSLSIYSVGETGHQVGNQDHDRAMVAVHSDGSLRNGSSATTSTNNNDASSARVGGAFKRCVQLLRSRSAVSQRDRPQNIVAPPHTPSTSRVILPDTSYEKACGSDRRGSAPATPILGGSRTHQIHHMRNDTTQYNNNGGSSTPSSTRFANFFSKRTIKNLPLKRTKSVTKLERSKRANNSSLLSSNHSIQSNTIHNNTTSNPLYQHPHQQPLDTSTQNLYHHNQQPSHHLSNTNLGGAAADGGAMARLRSSQSHESLLATHNQQMMNTLDLMAGESVIKPLHESILGQKFCFQISSPGGTRYYSCRTAEERDKWVESLRRAVNPQSDNKSRVHNSIKITIVEAKGITPKKKYFCELQLDETLYARTSSKQKQEMCFWGEPFEFKCLPAIHTVTVSLYREGEKRRKKDKQTLLGRVNIPVSTVSGRSMVEKWYPVEGANMSRSSKGGNANSKDNTPSLRIKCAFQSVHILPIQMYNDFHQYLMSSYSTLCALIEPVVSVATKADVATTLVHLTQHNHTATAFIADIVVAEIDKNDDAHLIFRGNSLATKAMEAFMKLVGERYLHDTLRPAIAHILVTEVDCEVDPKKVSNEAAIPKNRQNLISIVQMTWTKIIQSRVAFPPELRQCFVLFRERLQSMNKENLSDKLISASIFLRFLCPAILNPSLFNIIQELPDEKATRNLTLVAKTLQTLANFTKFQGKEQFMEFMNDFIEEEQSQMKSFLKKISTRSNIDQRALEYSGEIDLGIQLSVLQTLLSECSPNMKPDLSQESYKEKLQRIIKELDHAKSNPNNDLVQSLVSRGATSTTTTTAATIIDHQRLEKERQRLQPLAQNVIRYNDPTAITMCSNFPTEVQYNKGNVYNYHGAGGCSNSPMPPNVNDYTEFPCHQSNKINASPGPHNSSTPDQEPSTPRSSTLPRNTYLMGSGRKPPAMDLHTSDDYVHYSALGVESNEGQIHNKSPHPVGHSFSQSHVPSDSPSHQAGSSTPVQHSQQPPNHHQHFHNHMARYNNNNPLPYSGGGSNYGSPQQYGHPHAVTGHHNNGNTDDSLNSSHDYDQTCTADTETNMKGSQTSISQLSNIASSGYQSFAYSQSSSPVDPVITDVTNNNNNVNLNKNSHNNQKGNIGSNTSNNISNSLLSDPISVAQMPQITQVMQPPPQVAALAFNNPMYHLNNCSNSPRPNSNKIHPSQALAHHFLINGSSIQQQRAYPLMHSQSSHATNYSSSRDAAVHSSNNHLNHHCSSSLSSAHSVEDLGCAKVNLSGSDDTSSLVSTTSTPPPQKDMPRISNYSQTGNGGQALTHLNQHNNSNNNIFKSGAPRTNPRFAPPPPPWQQQQQQNLHHSSITNIPSSTNSNNTQRNNKSHLDHHHSTSDLLSSSSHPHPRSTSHKNSRRQSAEFAPSRQRLLLRNNNKYDSTSDDTSSDETAGNHHSNPPYSRAKNTNNNAALHGVPVNVPAAFSHRASNSNRVSDSKSLEEYENEILTLKRMLDNLQIELKEHQEQQLSGDSSISNNSSPISSSVSSNTPPSPAPTSPPITTKQPNHQYTSHQYDRGNSSEARQSPDNNDLRSSPINDRRTSGASTTTNIRISPPSFSVPSTSSQAQQRLSVAADSIEDPSADSAQQTKQLQELLKKLLAVQSEKDAVIAAQKQHITSLDDTNNRLRTAYQHLTKHINVMDLESANPETSAAVAAASATAIAAVGSAATDGSLDTTTPSSSYNRAGHIANTTEYSSGSKC